MWWEGAHSQNASEVRTGLPPCPRPSPPPFILAMSLPWRVHPYTNLSTQRKTLDTTERNARRPLMTFGTALQQGWWCGYGAGAVQALDLLTYLLCRSVTTACCYSHLLRLLPRSAGSFPPIPTSSSTVLLLLGFCFWTRISCSPLGVFRFSGLVLDLTRVVFTCACVENFFSFLFGDVIIIIITNNNNNNNFGELLGAPFCCYGLGCYSADSQSPSGSTPGGQHWCQQCSFACGCVPSVRQAGNLTLWSMTSFGLQEWSVFAQLHILLFSVLTFLEACGLGTHIVAFIITHFAKSDGPGVGGRGGKGNKNRASDRQLPPSLAAYEFWMEQVSFRTRC